MIDRARLETLAYAALRIIAGFMFLFHGTQKLIEVEDERKLRHFYEYVPSQYRKNC